MKYIKNLIKDYEKAIEKNSIWQRFTIGYDHTDELPKAYFTAIHKYGHQVNNRLIYKLSYMGDVSDELYSARRAVWNIWEKRYKKIRIKERWKVSEYAAKNPREGFAECWTAYVTGEKNVGGKLWELFNELLPDILELAGDQI